MEQLFEKMKEYLHMETEIPLDEFSEYHKKVIQTLTDSFEDMDEDMRLKSRYICSIVQANADSRAKRSKKNGKLYKKISAKAGFWMDAINFRMIKDGMTQADIDKKMEEINEVM
ncbi:hypothetical protein [Desulfitobacterium metallireducens]|uniref:Uncharacterized protein n=1 Tax=Desulfitobacterium metallireducens DSM 15288 TaxID=871968 RepID=W0EE23_9FIRM|nr:hypothetical protein [Desulfitobacterium metallireducens]AHF07316.1 hypothetical protein DESME_09960 [Desulfitobacterium metallireducens DSM 15288]